MDTILLIEDDPNIIRGLQLNLRIEGFRPVVATDGEQGLEAALREKPSLILLDIMLPRMNGYEVLRELRRLEINAPIIMLTARGTEVDKVLGLDLGADDYVTKPFGLAELLARIKAVLRRHRQSDVSAETVLLGDVRVNFTARELVRDGVPLPVSARELELLRYLIRTADQAVSRERILQAVWGHDYEGTERTVDNFIQKLREKLEADPSNPRIILTVRGVGYRLVRAENAG
jgi:DNA-binding response OmpR family regulator